MRDLFYDKFTWIERDFIKEEARKEILNCCDLDVLVPLDIDNVKDRSHFIVDLLKFKKNADHTMVSKRIDDILSLIEIVYPGDLASAKEVFCQEEARKKLSDCSDLYIFVPSNMDDRDDRREFIIELLNIKENMEKDEELFSIAEKRSYNRVMDILDAIQTVYPGEINVIMASEIASKRIVEAKLRRQELPKSKEKEQADEENDLQLVKGKSEPQYVDVHEQNKNRIDSFITWVQKQPRGLLEKTYSKCIVELTTRYALFLKAWGGDAEERSSLIKQFRRDALEIILVKITKSSHFRISYDKLVALKKEFIKQTTLSSLSASSAASSSSSRVANSSNGGSDSPPSSFDKQYVTFFQSSEPNFEISAGSDSDHYSEDQQSGVIVVKGSSLS